MELDESDGQLRVHTDVAGRAAKMGHRLTLAVNSWRATVDWSEGEPTDVELTVDVESLEVLHGEGGVTPLLGPEKALARSNAMKVLDVQRFPQIRFRAHEVREHGEGYRLTGTLEIHGTVRDRVIDVGVRDLGDAWEVSCEAEVRQTDFGVKPYSMLMGSMKVADVVTVSFTVKCAKA